MTSETARPKLEKQDVSYFSPTEIQQATENGLLYDAFAPNVDTDDYRLYKAIEAEGIQCPIHVSADMFLLDGHRRLAVARWLGLTSVPCIVRDGIVWSALSHSERLAVLAGYNAQRDKSHTERLREAMLEINPDEAYHRVLADRRNRRHIRIDQNVILGAFKKRARITTKAFLQAAQRAIELEKEYWPLTVRRVHYLLLNDPPLLHDKKTGYYQNNLKCYKKLSNLLLRARLAGDIPHEAIEDDTRPIRVVATYQNPAEYIASETGDFLRHYARDILRGQVNHIEILCEKDGLRRHVELVADEYCTPCTTGKGYSSLTPRLKLVRRFKQSGKEHLVLLILSDFDPDGEVIASCFPRSLRDDFGLHDVTAHKVAISGDDVRKHNLPFDMEAKAKSPNYKKFVAIHGIHVAELDAAPVNLLQEKLRTAIESCLDMKLFRAELAQEKNDIVLVAATKKAVLTAMGANQ